MLLLKRPKLYIPLLFLLIILINLSLYRFHQPTNQAVDELWVQYSFKTVDQYRLNRIYSGSSDLRTKLALEFPYTKSTEPIPHHIWQMWKTDDVDSLDSGLKDLIRTWVKQDNFTHKIIRNDKFVEFINQTYYQKVPEIVEAFEKMPLIILQSDFIRYLILFAFGGVYSDIDTSLNRNLTDWLSYKNTITPENNEIGLVIGIESDRDEKNWARNGMARRLQFCQWTLQAKNGHPFYRELVYRIADLSLKHYDPKTKILTKNGKEYDFNDGSETKFAGVMEWTGPGMFTDTVFSYLNEVYKTSERLDPSLNFSKDKIINPNLELNLQSKVRYQRLRGSWHNEYDPVERPIGWQNITKQVKPILFDDDVLLLPHAYFGGKMGEELDYTQHHFKGSWKTSKG